MPVDFDTNITTAGFMTTVLAEEPWATFITDNPDITDETEETRILALMAVLHGYMRTLRNRTEARLAHYCMARMLTKYGNGGFIYSDLRASVEGNKPNALLLAPAEINVTPEGAGTSLVVLPSDGVITSAVILAAINTDLPVSVEAVLTPDNRLRFQNTVGSLGLPFTLQLPAGPPANNMADQAGFDLGPDPIATGVTIFPKFDEVANDARNDGLEFFGTEARNAVLT